MKAEENALLVKVGPGTPMGRTMRRYWHPIALSSQVPTPDCDPLATKLLGERFVVFRDSAGQVGVLEERCMHRGVSLCMGRVEEGGIRCIYHGWKFDVNGNILDTPNHAIASYRRAKKARALKVREESGIVWAYMGPPEKEPPFRSYAFSDVPVENLVILRSNVKSTYLSMWEGGVDSSHVGVLHTNQIRPSWLRKRKGEAVEADAWDSLAPSYDVQNTEYGFRYVAFRDIPSQPDMRQARVVPTMMPGVRVLPGPPFEVTIFEVPIDDGETSTYTVVWSRDRKVGEKEVEKFMGLTPVNYDPVTHDVKMSWPDKIHQQRSAMHSSWSGFEGVKHEDLAVALSLAEDWDRTSENLVAADIAVARLRQMLRKAVEKNEAGEDPTGVSISDMSNILPVDRAIAKTADWKMLANEPSGTARAAPVAQET